MTGRFTSPALEEMTEEQQAFYKLFAMGRRAHHRRRRVRAGGRGARYREALA